MTHQLYKLSRLSNSGDKIVFKCLFEENIQPALFGRIQAMYGNCGFPGTLAGLAEFELCFIKPHKSTISYNLVNNDIFIPTYASAGGTISI